MKKRFASKRVAGAIAIVSVLAVALFPGAAAAAVRRDWAHDSVGTPTPAQHWYLAEGATTGGFETWVLVLNPNEQAANVSLTLDTDKGVVEGPSFKVPGLSRHTFNIGDSVKTYEVSTRITADVPVVCERAMYGNGRQWAHESVGAAAPARDWYLAEGATAADFETWVLVQNPDPGEADVSLTFLTDKGAVDGPHVKVSGQSRRSFNVGDYVKSYNVSTRVRADRGIVCERAMYGAGRQWAHDSVGVTAPATDWYMAEGASTGGFETWVLVQNPNDGPAKVSLSFDTGGGAVQGPTEEIPARTRRSFNVGDYVKTYDVSTRVTSDAPVVCERATYGGGRTWAQESVGVTGPAGTWYFAEGSTGPGFETWVLVENPGEQEASVSLEFFTDKGRLAGPKATVGAHSRHSFNVGEAVQTYEVSTKVTSSVPVACERAMYGASSSTSIPAPLDGTPIYPFTRDASIACGHWGPGSTDYPYFGAPRNGTRLHAGIDIYPPAGRGAPVYAIKDGTVVRVEPFYTRADGEVTYAMLVNHGDYVANYGEIQPPALKPGDRVTAGQVIGHVSGTVQLHFELYTAGTTDWGQWYGAQPSNLLDPTRMILDAFGL